MNMLYFETKPTIDHGYLAGYDGKLYSVPDSAFKKRPLWASSKVTLTDQTVIKPMFHNGSRYMAGGRVPNGKTEVNYSRDKLIVSQPWADFDLTLLEVVRSNGLVTGYKVTMDAHGEQVVTVIKPEVFSTRPRTSAWLAQYGATVLPSSSEPTGRGLPHARLLRYLMSQQDAALGTPVLKEVRVINTRRYPDLPPSVYPRYVTQGVEITDNRVASKVSE